MGFFTFAVLLAGRFLFLSKLLDLDMSLHGLKSLAVSLCQDFKLLI